MKVISRYFVALLIVGIFYPGLCMPNHRANVATLDSTSYGIAKKLIGFQYIKKYNSFPTIKSGPTPGLEESLLHLQRMAGLQETGEIDEPTARLMTWPRCGVPDTAQINNLDEVEASKRFVVAGANLKWNKLDLTYKIKNYPNTTISVITHEEVDDAVSNALKFWSDVTPLTFTRVPSDNPADIVLLFGSRVHTTVPGDPSFDGPSGTLAHAFTPNSGWANLNGDVHYDDDESFTHKKYFGRNLQYVTAHEAGHALGLDHSDVSGALMWPWIIGYVPNYELPDDDRLGIQEIYGENPSPPIEQVTTTLPPTTTPVPHAPTYCNAVFDDVAVLRGELFAFKGNEFWRFSLDGHLINGLEGSLIRGFFQKVPSTVSAIFERWYDEKIILVKGGKYWYLDGIRAADGYPLPLSDMGIPRGIDGTMHRASTGVTYYFKAKQAYEYDEYQGTLIPDTPRRIHHIFPGIPRGTKLTGAFTGVDGYGYLISGENYYTVNPNMESDGVMRNFAQDFLRCSQ